MRGEHFQDDVLSLARHDNGFSRNPPQIRMGRRERSPDGPVFTGVFILRSTADGIEPIRAKLSLRMRNKMSDSAN